jgi:hypothetical protein
MKNWILFIGFGLFVFAGSANAQTCSHGSKSAQAKKCEKPSEAALKAASLDPTIETKVCEKGGYACFMKTTTDAQGNVTKSEVKYDEAKAQFVSISDADMKDAKNGKACSMSKACCAKGAANGKACCKAKGTASVNSPADVAPATPTTKSE